jgi:hypothetical protein
MARCADQPGRGGKGEKGKSPGSKVAHLPLKQAVVAVETTGMQ